MAKNMMLLAAVAAIIFKSVVVKMMDVGNNHEARKSSRNIDSGVEKCRKPNILQTFSSP